MNVQRIKTAIAIMQRAAARDSVYMPCYQSGADGMPDSAQEARTEAEFHTCGNKACFAGHVAISPEFQADGGECNASGLPIFNGYSGACAISEWLGIPNRVADSLVLGDVGYDEESSKYYHKSFYEVNAHDVIDKLEQLLLWEIK